MSGHSKWSQIKHKKAATDEKRGKLFSKISRFISVAVKEMGADPSANPKLKLAIEKAKEANMPSENIEKAIKKGTGATNKGDFEEITYEAYGPSGTAILIESITDNRNRTLNEIKRILNQYGAKMASSGSALWAFEKPAGKKRWKPKHLISLANNEDKTKLKNLLSALENNDDIQNVTVNADLSKVD
jgi:YebC/PmpR family DNA-binding regulatory protein